MLLHPSSKLTGTEHQEGPPNCINPALAPEYEPIKVLYPNLLFSPVHPWDNCEAAYDPTTVLCSWQSADPCRINALSPTTTILEAGTEFPQKAFVPTKVIPHPEP